MSSDILQSLRPAAASAPPEVAAAMHAVHFYDNEDRLCTTIAEWVAAGLGAGEPVFLIVTSAHQHAVRRHLMTRCIDFDRAVEAGFVVPLPAEATLAGLTVNGEPSCELFDAHVGRTVRALRTSHGTTRIRAYGEMVNLLWSRGESRAAIRLEEMWNELAKRDQFALLCGYSLDHFRASDQRAAFQAVCAQHTHVQALDDPSSLESDHARLFSREALEQRAQRLQAEIQRREEIERELRVQREQLRRREEELRDFIENGLEGIHWVGPDGTILFANQAELELLGYAREEYIGRPIRDFHVDDDVIGDILSKLRSGETLRDYEARLRCKDGSIKHVLIHSNVYWRDGEFVHTRCFTRDVTDRKRAEESLREQNRINEELVRIGLILASELDVGALLQKVTDQATSLCRAQLGAFFHNVVNEDGESYMLYTLSGTTREAFSHLPMPRNTAVFEATFSGRGVVRCHDVTQDPRYGLNAPYQGTPRGHPPVRSYLAVPVRSSSGGVLGGLFFGHPEPGVFRESDEKLMQAIAGQAAVALDNAALYQAARRAEEAAQRERAKLEAVAHELEQANRAKDSFLAMVSHELRTPLTAMLGWVRMLRVGGLTSAKSERALATIERNAHAQAQLIEDLLDVSRIISGKLRLDMQRFQPSVVVEQAIEAVGPAAQAKAVAIRKQLDVHAGPILGDPARLQQVVWNLLSNAVKFTPQEGWVQVAVRRQGGSVEIVVEDSGEGIEPAFLPCVFDRFRQADESPSRKHGGLGLGLAIVRHLVELHGGSVRAESDGPGRGAGFYVSLPISPQPFGGACAALSQPNRPPARRLGNAPELEGVTVLVVDDEADACELLAEVLTASNIRVVTANSSAQALNLVQELRPDIIVSDIGMPGEDGYVFIQKLRALPDRRVCRTPAVALTAHTRVEDRTKALVAGFNMHVPKPVEPAELLAVLSSLSTMFAPGPG